MGGANYLGLKRRHLMYQRLQDRKKILMERYKLSEPDAWRVARALEELVKKEHDASYM